MLRQSLSSKRASALDLPLAHLVSHTKIPLYFQLLAILSPCVVVLTYMIRIFNVGGGNKFKRLEQG